MPNQAADAQAKVHHAAIAKSIDKEAGDKTVAFLYAPPPIETQLFYFTKTSAYLALDYSRYLTSKQSVDKQHLYLLEKNTWESMKNEHPTLEIIQSYTVEHAYIIHLLQVK